MQTTASDMPPILSFVYGLLPVLSLKSQAKFPTNGHDTDRTYAVFCAERKGNLAPKHKRAIVKTFQRNYNRRRLSSLRHENRSAVLPEMIYCIGIREYDIIDAGGGYAYEAV